MTTRILKIARVLDHKQPTAQFYVEFPESVFRRYRTSKGLTAKLRRDVLAEMKNAGVDRRCVVNDWTEYYAGRRSLRVTVEYRV